MSFDPHHGESRYVSIQNSIKYRELFVNPPLEIVYCYGAWQDKFNR